MDSNGHLTNLTQHGSGRHSQTSASDEGQQPSSREKSQRPQKQETRRPDASPQKGPQARISVPQKQVDLNVPKPSHDETIFLIMIVIILMWLGTYVFFLWRLPWLRLRRYFWKFSAAASLSGISVVLSYAVPIWPIYLAAELGVVALGLVAGWCWVDFDRRKVRGPLKKEAAKKDKADAKGGVAKAPAFTAAPQRKVELDSSNPRSDPNDERDPLDPNGDLDQLGFFNSRIAMRSLELFKITIADIPMKGKERKTACRLVENYWTMRQQNVEVKPQLDSQAAGGAGDGN